jgi:hypothetical protein
MAILNLTDNSFSGDGTGADLDAAVRRAAVAYAEGADIIDVGGECARADVRARRRGGGGVRAGGPPHRRRDEARRSCRHLQAGVAEARCRRARTSSTTSGGYARHGTARWRRSTAPRSC